MRGNERTNTQSRGGLMKPMQCRCGGKADCGGAQEHRTETCHENPENTNKMKLKSQDII